MQKTVMMLCASASLMGCGGAGNDFVGTVFVDPDETGAVEGVTELTQVDSAVGGFVYGYDTGLRALDFQDNATSADRANYAYSGILPTNALGDVPLSGTAVFVGTYEAVMISGYRESFDPANWTEERQSGGVTVDVDFGNGTLDGRSDDGQLVIRYTGTPSNDPSDPALTDSLFGDLTYQGVSGNFEGEVGANGIIGAMNGQDDTRFFAGGFVADNQ